LVATVDKAGWSEISYAMPLPVLAAMIYANILKIEE
jgi:hypothetical protein